MAPSSAAAQSKEDLRTQTKLRKIAEEKAMKIKARCEELERRLTLQATQKRKAEMQRKSKQRDAEHRDPSRKKPRASPQPMTDLIASQHMSEDSASTSDDGVATPEEPAEAPPLYQKLNSILCEYKAGRITPEFRGEISLEICAEMCEEEADDVDRWTADMKKTRRPMIISALQLTYPAKPREWF